MGDLKSNIEELITPWLKENDLFLVEVTVSASYKIQVFVDGVPSVTIEQCRLLSRFVEKYLDEEPSVPEKYTLEVSSPGMTNPLKVTQQYQKRIGSTLKITTVDGEQIAIILKEIKDGTLTGLKTEIQKKSKRPAKKINEEDLQAVEIDLKDITKALLHFNF